VHKGDATGFDELQPQEANDSRNTGGLYSILNAYIHNHTQIC